MDLSERDLLNRIDERTTRLLADLNDIRERLDKQYVTNVEFEARILPLQRVVYGAVGAILLSIISAIAALVLNT